MKEIEVNELMHAVDILEKSSDACIVQNVINALKGIVAGINEGQYRSETGASDYAVLADLNAYIATILWKEDDLAMFFEEFTHEKPTEKNKEKLYSYLDVDGLKDSSISKGWDAFQTAYDKAVTADMNAFKTSLGREKIEEMALQIRNLLREYGLWQNVRMFYNDMEVISEKDPLFLQEITEDSTYAKPEEQPEVRVDGLESGQNILSMVYEGPLMQILNCDRNDQEAETVRKKLKEIMDRHGLWYECVNGFSCICRMV